MNQAKYTKELIKKFKQENAKVIKTPMETTSKLDKDEQGKCINIELYRRVIGNLLNLMASRTDIMFSLCVCARSQSCSKESHLNTVKRIIKYLTGTIGKGLWYPKIGQFNMTSYSDADYASCRVDRKSTTGTCQFL